jgi:ABC-type uncharacterized transport system substrate-binding protein
MSRVHWGIVAALAVVLCLSDRAAQAHPHVWVDWVVTALVEGGKVTALREEWWFDEEFTVMALSEARKTKGMAAALPRPLNPGEIDQLKAKAFSNLANYAYFTHVWAAGKPTAVAKEVSSFTARMDGAKLAYVFTLPLAVPVEPNKLRVGIWDESYYVDVGPVTGRSPVGIEGDAPASCKARIIDDKDHPIYNGSITPKVIDIAC